MPLYFSESLKDYFSQFGEVQECTVMRDGATGRSRGFGFLTFRDPRTVNIVMVKEHYLDGKIVRPSILASTKAPSRLSRLRNRSSQFLPLIKIDPKRAIPRDEQERTSKIFVGGVSQDATEQDFKEYFMQYGRVVDATLMIDKDTGRPRGFGFVTFDNESAVDATLQGDLTILGKPIEVKKAQPRGNMRDEDEGPSRRGGRRGGKDNERFRDNDRNNFENNNANNQSQIQNQQNGQGMYGTGGMTPQMMAQYWQRMQQYFAQMQQQMAAVAAAQGGGMGGNMGMGGMNPAMMQQMQLMQQYKQMQAMQQQMGRQQGSQSPHPQSPGAQGMQGMNAAMMQQMQQLQQMQMQSQQAQGATGFGVPLGGSPMVATPVPAGPSMGGYGGGGGGGGGGRRETPGYNAQEQLLFEQQKYEQQQARRAAQEAQQMQQYQQGGPTSWEGMYDDVPQPNLGGGQGRGLQQGGFGRQMSQGSNGSGNKAGQQQNRGSQGPTGPQSAPPANAPTGPKNAGVPGANYRGGGRGGNRGGFHPYARK
ncbi:hypothetical protein MMC24_003495 [Lignoscripta atroalba]|nr:hypothetical protein [Lignoscripta atroalba]